jgi:hypothetical protein
MKTKEAPTPNNQNPNRKQNGIKQGKEDSQA